jgi:hypothetical protein
MQRTEKAKLTTLCDYQIEQAYRKKRLTTMDAEYEIVMDEVSAVDLEHISGAVTQLAIALQTAEAQSWISTESARKAFAKLIGQANLTVQETEEDALPIPRQLKDVASAFTLALEARKKASRTA